MDTEPSTKRLPCGKPSTCSCTGVLSPGTEIEISSLRFLPSLQKAGKVGKRRKAALNWRRGLISLQREIGVYREILYKRISLHRKKKM